MTYCLDVGDLLLINGIEYQIVQRLEDDQRLACVLAAFRPTTGRQDGDLIVWKRGEQQ